MEKSQIESGKLKKGALILVLSSALVKIISALFKIPLASDLCLGDLGFGYFSSAHDVFMPINFIAVSGFPVAISHIVADFIAKGNIWGAKQTLSASKKLLFMLGFAFLVLYLICIFPFVIFTDKTGNSIYSFLAVAPTIVFCLWSACYRGYYEGLGNMRPAAVSCVIEALGKLVLGLGLALVVMKLCGNTAYASAAAIFGISVGTLLSAIYLKIKYKKNDGLKTFGDATATYVVSQKTIMKTLLVISLPIVAASLSSSVVALIDGLTVRYQLSNLLSSNPDKFLNIYAPLFAELENEAGEMISTDILPTVLYGIRSKAFTLFNLIPTLTMSIGVGLIPVVTSSFTKGDKAALKSNVSAVIKLSTLICIPAGLGFIFFGERIMFLLYGSSVSSQIGGEMLTLYGLAAIFAGFSLPLASILQAIGKQGRAFINVACGIVLKIILNIILCSTYKLNVTGCAISTVACFILIFILQLISIFRNIGMLSDALNSFIKPVFAAAICIAAGYGISTFSSSSLVTVLSILTAVVVYLIFLIIFRTFDDTDILALPMGDKLLKVSKKMKILR